MTVEVERSTGLGVGIHDIPIDAYHADPCEEVSLSSSGISTLLDLTPAHFAARHPKLTRWPDMIEESTAAQDLGSVVHTLVLGKGSRFEVFDYDNWKKGAAQTDRDEAEARGSIAILRKVFKQAQEIADALTERLRQEFGHWPIGVSEQTLIWQRDTAHGPIWCRALTDHLLTPLMLDLKSTERCISDADMANKFAREGSDIQATFYTEGLETLRPEFAGRIEFTFIVAEVKPPFAVRLAPMPSHWMGPARMRIDRAANIFAKCLRSGEWPAWSDIAKLRIPTWRDAQWCAAEIEESREI